MASLSDSGLVPMSAAIAGSEVAMTVESMFSMNRATATISGTMRLTAIRCDSWRRRWRANSRAKSSRNAGRQALRRAKHCLDQERFRLGRPIYDLHPGSLRPGARPVAERPAVLGHHQPDPDRALHHLGVG